MNKALVVAIQMSHNQEQQFNTTQVLTNKLVMITHVKHTIIILFIC